MKIVKGMTALCLLLGNACSGMESLTNQESHIVAYQMNFLKGLLKSLDFEKWNEVDANIDVRDSHGDTALLYIARHHIYESPLIDAALKLLDVLGANINYVNKKDGLTPLLASFSKNGRRGVPDSAMAIALIKLGVQVNKARFDGITPLMIASNYNLQGVVQLLLQPKADVFVCDKTGYNAFHYANPECRRLFLPFIKVPAMQSTQQKATGAPVQTRAPVQSVQPKMAKPTDDQQQAHNGQSADVPVLLSTLKMRYPNSSYQALWLALTPEQAEATLTETLRLHGYEKWNEAVNFADVTDSHGDTPLLFIVRNLIGRTPVFLLIGLLRTLGADINLANKNDGYTPLIAALSKIGKRKIADEYLVAILLNEGADVNVVRPTDGVTPLMIAAGDDSLHEIIKMLLDDGACMDAQDRQGKIARDYASTANLALFE